MQSHHPFVEQKLSKTLSFSISGQTLNIIYSNISAIKIKFYLIDLEILFSRSPSIKTLSYDFGLVKPNYETTLTVKQQNTEDKVTYTIPEEFTSKNIFFEVSSGELKQFETYYTSNITAIINESFGVVKVCNNELKPLIKAYVKCFAKVNGEGMKFYKDGYTDLRGKFDYVSLSSDLIKRVRRFYLFISDEQLGSIIKECKPPENIQSKNGESFMVNLNTYKQQRKEEWRNQANLLSNKL